MPGRIGDTALIGSGLYVDNTAGAAAATGVGEAAIAECVSHSVVQLLRELYEPEEACAIVLHRILKKENWKDIRQLALIALRKDGKFGFSALSPGFQAAVYYQGISDLIDVVPIQKDSSGKK
jgi:N4-(beta-N-acetylglucosaminyl)-L-asparaginase